MRSKYIQRYEEIVDKLIKKSFPVLKNEEIEICERKMEYRGMAEFWPWRKRIIISTRVRRYRYEKVVGILVHELSHFEMNKKKGFLWYLIVWVLTHYSKRLQYKIEWETDMIIIRKGYGRYILFCKKNQTEKQRKGYMPIRVVGRLMKDFKEERI